MTRQIKNLRRIGRDENGAALVEFAFVAPVFLMMLMAAMDIGYGLYIRAIASGTLEASARAGSLQGATESQLTAGIREDIFKILPEYARNDDNVAITTKNYTDYSRIDSAEKITVDNDDDGELDEGDCWIDEDGNNEFGVNEGANGIGGADDGVYYDVTITMPALFPLYDMLNLPAEQSITVKTLVINQPFGVQAIRPTVCLEDD
jgi:Flp pilus assembly pilin Flp